MNDKVKAIFFAQYYGQCVVQVSKGIGNNLQPVSTGLLERMEQFDNPYLLLRSINDLTDEECLTICKIYDSNCTWSIKDTDYKLGCILFESPVELLWVFKDVSEPIFCCEDKKGGSNSPYNILGAYDYLRSIGIALPFTYLNDQNQPETYSVEKLVELGWLTIKPNN